MILVNLVKLSERKQTVLSAIIPKSPLTGFQKLNMENVVDVGATLAVALNIRRPQWSPNLGQGKPCPYAGQRHNCATYMPIYRRRFGRGVLHTP